MRHLAYTLFIIGIYSISCTPEPDVVEEKLITEVRISLDSAKFQRVYDFIDHRMADSLTPYLSHRDPSYRVLATQGFSGMMDEEYIDKVGDGMMDPIVEVRRASAFVLGQSHNTKAVPYLMRIFKYQDSIGIDPLTFKYALEAIGKCADSSYLSLLSGISTYQPRDTLLLEGQSLGILGMAQRGYSDTTATALMIQFATDEVYGSSVTMIASNYLATTDGLDLSTYHKLLISVYGKESDPEIRMFIARAMGRTGQQAGTWIRQAVRDEKDDRVRIELLRGSVSLPLSMAHGIWSSVLNDQNDLVARTAADLIVDYGSSGYSEVYTNWAFSQFKPVVYARILAAGNRFIANTRFRQMIQELIFQRIRSTSDPYIKSDFIKAAGQRLETARQLITYDGEEVLPIIRTSIIEAIVHAVNFAGNIGSQEKDFLINRWKSGDVAAISILSPFFVEQKNLFSGFVDDEELWKAQSDNIKMPAGVEARIQIDQSRQNLFGIQYDPYFYRTKSLFTHEIDWSLYKQLSDQPRAELSTSAGVMNLQLFKKEAPATVINFIKLAESGYYDGKVIHRVVPGFVVQGGGNRGDGYGSMDYTIRSELSPMSYDRSGLVGMASAGLDTESQQWFVTLRPTLHLNGRYTQFARITEGKEVLESLRRGDKIEKVKIYR